MTTENKPTEASEILAAGVALGDIRGTDDGLIPFVIVPKGYELRDLEYLFAAPTRKRAKLSVSDADSFRRYMFRHGTPSTSTIYADIDREAGKFVLVGVLDDHRVDGAGWREHTCTMTRKQSVEWKRWTSKNKVFMNQGDFATYLEENLSDVAQVDGMPTGGDILQMALAFERTAEKKLKSKINLQSGGVRFEYTDDDDKDTRTSMNVFERFAIGIPVFEGSKSAYQIDARLKYRDNSGKLTFWFELIRADRVFGQAVSDELEVIGEATGMLILNGAHGAA